MRLLLLLLCPSAALGALFDLTNPGWAPAWENVTSGGISALSECALLCTATAGCLGGRHEPSAQRCHLTLQIGARSVMHYKNLTGASQDETFGGRCDPTSGFTKFASRSVWGYDIEDHWSSSLSACMSLCKQRFWCRSFELRHRDSLCTLGAISNTTHSLKSDKFDFYNRNC